MTLIALYLFGAAVSGALGFIFGLAHGIEVERGRRKGREK